MSAQASTRSSLTRSGRRTVVLLAAGLATSLALGACSPGAVTSDADAALTGGGHGLAGDGSGDGNGGNGTGYGGGGRYGGDGGGGNGGYGSGSGGIEARGSGESGDISLRIADMPVATLTAEEIDGLVWMREEEKLAHDVYVALGETWGSRVFENIAGAETTHTEAVKTLLDRYGITDPAAGRPAGEFTNPDLQALYTDLVARGRTSLVDAFTVGALIEDLDISDLRTRATGTADIALVYADLEHGSENHLRAFTRNLDRQGVSYTPTYISADEFETIIGSPIGQGRSG